MRIFLKVVPQDLSSQPKQVRLSPMPQPLKFASRGFHVGTKS